VLKLTAAWQGQCYTLILNNFEICIFINSLHRQTGKFKLKAGRGGGGRRTAKLGGATTFGITTLSIMTLRKMDLIVTLYMTETWRKF
jgi:hypothetical protein